MQTLETRLASELVKLIDARIEERKELLARNNFERIEQFKVVMGEIAAHKFLRDELIPMALETINKR